MLTGIKWSSKRTKNRPRRILVRRHYGFCQVINLFLCNQTFSAPSNSMHCLYLFAHFQTCLHLTGSQVHPQFWPEDDVFHIRRHDHPLPSPLWRHRHPRPRLHLENLPLDRHLWSGDLQKVRRSAVRKKSTIDRTHSKTLCHGGRSHPKYQTQTYFYRTRVRSLAMLVTN